MNCHNYKVFFFLAALSCLLSLQAFCSELPEGKEKNNKSQPKQEASVEKATFAGGCFWCMEKPFDHIAGVLSTTVGYSGGHLDNPSYEDVSGGSSGHIEAIQIEYDPSKTSYPKLLEVFWKNIDPLDGGGQFCDRGDQYRSAIFYHDQKQKELATKSKSDLKNDKSLEGAIATELIAAAKFYPAEDYHQNYYKRNPLRYRFYRSRCGRDKRLSSLWGNENDH